MLHISGIIHDMIFIYGTHAQNDNMSRPFFIFSELFFVGFWGGGWDGGSKRTKNGQK